MLRPCIGRAPSLYRPCSVPVSAVLRPCIGRAPSRYRSCSVRAGAVLWSCAVLPGLGNHAARPAAGRIAERTLPFLSHATRSRPVTSHVLLSKLKPHLHGLSRTARHLDTATSATAGNQRPVSGARQLAVSLNHPPINSNLPASQNHNLPSCCMCNCRWSYNELNNSDGHWR